MTCLFLLIISQQGLIVLHFKLNQQVIEQEFCINKDKPELQCHGNCHLKKELKQTDNTDWDSIIIFKNIDYILNSEYEFLIQSFNIIKNGKTSIYSELNHPNPHLKIFIPPPDFKFSFRNYLKIKNIL